MVVTFCERWYEQLVGHECPHLFGYSVALVAHHYYAVGGELLTVDVAAVGKTSRQDLYPARIWKKRI